MSKKLEDYNNGVLFLVKRIDVELDNGPFDIYKVPYDASIEDVINAMEYILDRKWFSKDALFARKIIMKDYHSDSIISAIGFSDKLEYFERDQKNNFSYPIDSFPTIIGISENDEKTSGAYILDDNILLTYDEWKEKYHMNLKKGDLVITKYNDSAFSTIDKIDFSIYQGIKDNTNLHLLSDIKGKNEYLAEHGPYTPVDNYDRSGRGKNYFLSYEEYKLLLQNYLEKIEKSSFYAQRRWNLETELSKLPENERFPHLVRKILHDDNQ